MYDTSIVEIYLETATIKENSKFHKTTLPHDMILTNEYSSISDEQVEVLSREYKIHYRACVESLICLLSTRMDFCFTVHKVEKFSSNPSKVTFESLVQLLG